MLTLGGIAVAIMVVILLLLFKVRWRLLPLLVILVGVVWAFGLAGYLGIPLTIVTIAGLPVMLGVGIDYAIQMHARVEEEAVLDRSEHPIQETARNLGPALLVVTFDAIFAFAALHFAKVPMIRDFGLLLAVGIAAICLCSIILPLAILGIREHRSPTTGKDFREGALGKIVVFLGRVPSGFAIPLAIASVVIFVWGISVEDDLTLQTDPVQWVNQDSQAIKDLNAVEEATNSTSELGVFVQSDDVFSDETVQFVHDFTRDQLASYDGALLTGSSIETSVGDLITVPGATDIAPTGDEVRAAFDVAPDDLKASTVSPEATDMNIVFRAGPSSLEDRAPIVQNIRDNTETPEGISLTPSGPRRRRRRAPREPRGEPRRTDLPRAALRVPVPRGPAAVDRAVAALARAGRHRRRSRVDHRVHVQPQAEPDDGRRRSARDRGLHRVHVVDPAAVRRRTRPRILAARGDGRDGVPHGASVHRFGAHRDLRRRGALVLFASAAARLRSRRRDERHRGTRVRARRPPADARLGRPAQPRVARAHQDEAAVRGGTAGAVPRARDGFVTARYDRRCVAAR